MRNKFLVSMAVAASVFMMASVSFAGDECQKDSDCKDGMVCRLTLTPHACKPPAAAGEKCKRDAVCASKKCDIPSGADVGICK